MVIKVRAVYGSMTCSAETGTSWHTAIVIGVSYEKPIGICLCLKMAFKAEIRVSCVKKFVIHRTMDFMTDSTTFSHRFMFKYKWSPLFLVAFKAYLVCVKKTKLSSMAWPQDHGDHGSLHNLLILQVPGGDIEA